MFTNSWRRWLKQWRQASVRGRETARRRPVRGCVLKVEELQPLILLSGSASPIGLTPAQIQHIYGVDQISFNGVTGDGTGQTIAVVDAYDDPNILGDLQGFDQRFNLPDPGFNEIKLNDVNGNPPATDPGDPNANPPRPAGSWEGETALDVEWAHAIAPGASILLVEVAVPQPSLDPTLDELISGAQAAAQVSGVSVVSMSWAGPEFGSGETSYDSDFTTPTGGTGITFVAGSGDTGGVVQYPAASPNVLAVGGTTLGQLDANNDYPGETAWSQSGGGVSAYESQPFYQNGVVTQSTQYRATPDVAFDADPNTGVAVYDSYNNDSSTPWYSGMYGGTSLAAPAWAGLIAIADQGRALNGLGNLDGSTQTLPRLYNMPASDFHQIGSGYSLATGLGTPNAPAMVADLMVPNAAAYVTETLPPTTMTAGQSYPVSITMKNTGTATWTAGTNFNLGPQEPQDNYYWLGSVNRVAVPSDVVPGQTVTFSFTITAPTTAGQYTYRWQMVQDGVGHFGDFTTREIITVKAAAVDHFNIFFPSNPVAGQATSVVVTAQDAYNNTVTDFTGAVSLTSTDPYATLPSGAYTFTTTDNGQHAFLVTLRLEGNQGVTASSGSSNGLGDITVSPSPGNAAYFVGQSAVPQVVIVGQSFQVTIQMLNMGSNTWTVNGSNPYHLGSEAPQDNYYWLGSMNRVALSRDVPGGQVATFTFTATAPTQVGLYTFQWQMVQETIGHFGDLTTSVLVTVNPGPLAHFNISFPSNPVAGQATSVVVTAQDAYNNTVTGFTGAVSLTSTDPYATLPPSYTFTTADNGRHAFPITLRVIGNQGVTASSGSSSGLGDITVSPSPGNAGFFISQATVPQLVLAGQSFSASIQMLNMGANAWTPNGNNPYRLGPQAPQDNYYWLGSMNRVALPSTVAPGQTVTFNFTATAPAQAGPYTFQWKMVQEGIGWFGDLSTAVVVRVARLNLAVPGSVVAGVPATVTVAAQDQNGNPVPNFTGTVSLTSTDPSATLPPSYTFTASDRGVHTFSITLRKAGTQSVTASSAGVASSQNILVTPAATASMTLSGPASLTAGASGSFTITAYDAFGNVAAGYRGTVHFTSTDGRASLPANYTFTAADNGVHTFSITLKAAGTTTVTAQDTVTSGIHGSKTVTVTPAAVSHFVVRSSLSNITAGSALNITVTAEDAFQNIVHSYRGTVQFLSTDPMAVLPANYAFSAADNGVHTFSATLKKAGAQTVTAQDTATTALKGTSANITVNPATASRFLFSQVPSSTPAGTAFTITVTAVDAYGNVATGYRGTVQFGSSDSAATLPSNYMFTVGDNGVHTFTITLATKGWQTLTIHDLLTPSISGTSNSIDVV